MVCVYCGSKLTVSNSRHQKRTNSIWRRRACSSCKAVFTSVEALDLKTSLAFKSRSSHTEPFSRDKLFISIYQACKHRKRAIDDAGHLSETIIRLLGRSSSSAIVSWADVIKISQEVLANFDTAAESHYKAYHPL